jgi:hypothetical protein
MTKNDDDWSMVKHIGRDNYIRKLKLEYLAKIRASEGKKKIDLILELTARISALLKIKK